MSLCIATPRTEEGEDEGSQGRRTRTGEIEDGGGGESSLGWDHLHRLLCWEIMRAHKAVLGGGQGHRGGEPSIRKVSSVESGAGVCARGLPQTVPPTLHTSLKLRPLAHVARDTSLPLLCCLSPTVTTASDMAAVGSCFLGSHHVSFKYSNHTQKMCR